MIEWNDSGMGGHISGLPMGSYCRVYPAGVTGEGGWKRKTCNGSKPGIRYKWYPTFEAAQKGALEWANKKDAQAKKAAAAALEDFNYVGSRHHY